MQYSIKAFVKKESGRYIAECLDVEATAEGWTLDETVEGLRAEISRRLEGADLFKLGFCEDPTLFITFEDVPLAAPLAGM